MDAHEANASELVRALRNSTMTLPVGRQKNIAINVVTPRLAF